MKNVIMKQLIQPAETGKREGNKGGPTAFRSQSSSPSKGDKSAMISEESLRLFSYLIRVGYRVGFLPFRWDPKAGTVVLTPHVTRWRIIMILIFIVQWGSVAINAMPLFTSRERAQPMDYIE